MRGACLWGADLTNANMSDANFEGSDFRAAILKDACLCDSDFSDVSFHGAYFSRTLLDGADLSGSRFSCPSVFSCDFQAVKNLKGTVYLHKGEIICALGSAPLLIQGLEKPIIIMDDAVLIGTDFYKMPSILDMQKSIIGNLCQYLIQS